jgi:hypothetical protein
LIADGCALLVRQSCAFALRLLLGIVQRIVPSADNIAEFIGLRSRCLESKLT